MKQAQGLRAGPGIRDQLIEGRKSCTKELDAARERERAVRAGLVTELASEPPRCNARVSMTNGMMRIGGGRREPIDVLVTDAVEMPTEN
jgi:hypothetical protein